jgi:type II secretory pathway component PulK
MKTVRPISMQDRRVRGSALLLVLWAIFMLSAAILAWVAWIETDLDRSADENRAIEAKAMAHSGIALGLHPLVSEKTPGLEETVSDIMGFRVRIVGEGGKLNINYLLQNEEPQKLEVLKLWLDSKGFTFQEREHFLDCLLDWVDGDDLKRLNGAEAEEDYVPSNRPFQTLEEIEQVRGAGPLLRSKGWKDEITIYSAQGMIDLSSATEPILKLLPGFSDARIQRFLQIRRGRDQLDGTIDDFQFKNLKEIASYIGMPEQQFNKTLGGLVVLKDQTQRIISEGRSGNVVRQVEVVARKGGANPQIIYWKE